MPKPKTAEPQRTPVGEKRRQAMIQAAYGLFMERGYESVSVDDIIRVSGGSKSTLYKYFGDKEGILKAVVTSLADEMLREINIEFNAGRTTRESLMHIGIVLTELALSENAINQHRQAVAHARAFPKLARLWFESGPKSTMDGIAKFLERETTAGRLRVDDPVRAAWFFCGMVIFRDNMQLLAGLPAATKADLQETVAQAVDLFLAAYGP